MKKQNKPAAAAAKTNKHADCASFFVDLSAAALRAAQFVQERAQSEVAK